MRNFDEVNENYTLPEAIAEAQRCLNCKVPLCQKGCPISNDIPDWIHELKQGNLGNAINIIHAKSNLPAVCGRVCGHERQCEGSCVLGKTGNHINIGKLERFVADFDAEAHLTHEGTAPKTRGKVAVIGSGPAGITVAGDLCRKGFQVEIFEGEPEPGGMLMFGIPEYRLPKEVVRREIKHLEEMGVVLHCKQYAGVDFKIDDLFANGFEAVFIGIGSGKPKKMDIPVINDETGEKTSSLDYKDVIKATHFLRRTQLYSDGLIDFSEVNVNPGDKVLVIGCGNTAMDAARTSVRLGAGSVDIVYHRTIDKMAALHSEYDDAVKEGVRFSWNASVVEVHTDKDGKMKNAVIEIAPETPEGTPERKVYEADKIMMAVGATPSTKIPKTTSGIAVDDRNFIITREVPYGMTTKKGVFAGGDVANRQATVVHAMKDAKMVAEGIAQYVDAIHLLSSIEDCK